MPDRAAKPKTCGKGDHRAGPSHDKLLDERFASGSHSALTKGAGVGRLPPSRGTCNPAMPMNRLLQGDVRQPEQTVVALYAMLIGRGNKLQTALLAPTKCWPRQHFLTLSRALDGSNVRIEPFHRRTKEGPQLTSADLSEAESTSPSARRRFSGRHRIRQPRAGRRRRAAQARRQAARDAQRKA